MRNCGLNHPLALTLKKIPDYAKPSPIVLNKCISAQLRAVRRSLSIMKFLHSHDTGKLQNLNFTYFNYIYTSKLF